MTTNTLLTAISKSLLGRQEPSWFSALSDEYKCIYLTNVLCCSSHQALQELQHLLEYANNSSHTFQQIKPDLRRWWRRNQKHVGRFPLFRNRFNAPFFTMQMLYRTDDDVSPTAASSSSEVYMFEISAHRANKNFVQIDPSRWGNKLVLPISLPRFPSHTRRSIVEHASTMCYWTPNDNKQKYWAFVRQLQEKSLCALHKLNGEQQHQQNATYMLFFPVQLLVKECQKNVLVSVVMKLVVEKRNEVPQGNRSGNIDDRESIQDHNQISEAITNSLNELSKSILSENYGNIGSASTSANYDHNQQIPQQQQQLNTLDNRIGESLEQDNIGVSQDTLEKIETKTRKRKLREEQMIPVGDEPQGKRLRDE